MHFYNFKLFFLLILHVSLLFSLIAFHAKGNNITIQIMITACNRFNYLNLTLHSLFAYLYKKDKNIKFVNIFIDQGTEERYFIAKYYNIQNSFFMNPKSYIYSFNIIFSYLYMSYTFLLEEDWIIYKENVNDIFSNSVSALLYAQDIYGIILRKMVIKNATISTFYLKGDNIIIKKLIHPYEKRNFLNGPTIYKTSILKTLHAYRSEYETGLYFLKNHLYLAFSYHKYDKSLGIKFEHIGKNSTKSGLCKFFLY